jgi:hypothetical protein
MLEKDGFKAVHRWVMCSRYTNWIAPSTSEALLEGPRRSGSKHDPDDESSLHVTRPNFCSSFPRISDSRRNPSRFRAHAFTGRDQTLETNSLLSEAVSPGCGREPRSEALICFFQGSPGALDRWIGTHGSRSLWTAPVASGPCTRRTWCTASLNRATCCSTATAR